MTSDDARTAPTRLAIPAARRHVLLVEDEVALANLLAEILRRRHEVTIAANGADALKVIDERPDAFDLVLSDVHMPWMNGVDLHRALVTRRSSLAARFVLMSGAPVSPSHAVYLDQTGLTLLAKPFDVDALERALARSVDPRASG